jgi:hypothetical protein
MKSPLNARRFIQNEDFELAQSVKRQLMQLRSRPTLPSGEDIMSIARKAAFVASSHPAGRAALDKIRSEAWWAICKLAAATDRNTRLAEENRANSLVNTSLLWGRAIDLSQVWATTGEQLCRGLVDITTTHMGNQEFAGLPRAPTLALIAEINQEADAGVSANIGTDIVRRILEAIPAGSTVTFAADNIGALLSANGPIVRGTDAYRQVEHLAQAHNCSISFRKKAGTIIFCRSEMERGPVLAREAPLTQIPHVAIPTTRAYHPAN